MSQQNAYCKTPDDRDRSCVSYQHQNHDAFKFVKEFTTIQSIVPGADLGGDQARAPLFLI
jgi:hypothetical protein